MSPVTNLRQILSERRLASIGRANRKRDEEVIAELGLAPYFTDAYATTGVSGGDIAFIHDYIRTNRPRRVIEFGTGKSTWVIAKCMERYCWDYHGGDIALVSMEESEYWFNEQKRYFPKQEITNYDQFVQIILSEVENHTYRFIIGKSYTETPLEPFDLCFVDGPDAHGTCNMDFIKLLTQATDPMSAIIDSRKTTQMAYASLLGKEKLTRFHNGFCLVRDVTKDDLVAVRYASIFPERMKVLKF